MSNLICSDDINSPWCPHCTRDKVCCGNEFYCLYCEFVQFDTSGLSEQEALTISEMENMIDEYRSDVKRLEAKCRKYKDKISDLKMKYKYKLKK